MNAHTFWKLTQGHLDTIITIIALATSLWALVEAMLRVKNKKKKRFFCMLCIIAACIVVKIMQYAQVKAEEYVEVPNLVEKVRDDACSILSGMGLEYSLDIEDGDFVKFQIPAAGQVVPVGTTVQLSMRYVHGGNPEELSDRNQKLIQEVESLREQLNEIAVSEEYIIKDGVGKELIVADVLDYHNLINELRSVLQGNYSISLATYMKEAGYDVQGKKYAAIIDDFFDLSYAEQSVILSQMFAPMGVYEYSVATEYEYTADVEEEGGIKKFSNVKAHATNVEKRGILMFVRRGAEDDPFGLIERINPDLVYE